MPSKGFFPSEDPKVAPLGPRRARLKKTPYTTG